MVLKRKRQENSQIPTYSLELCDHCEDISEILFFLNLISVFCVHLDRHNNKIYVSKKIFVLSEQEVALNNLEAGLNNIDVSVVPSPFLVNARTPRSRLKKPDIYCLMSIVMMTTATICIILTYISFFLKYF